MKYLLSCALIIFLPAVAFGQNNTAVAGMQKGTPENDLVKAEVGQLLASTANRDQAWAAYLIGKYELKEMASQLYPLLNPQLNGPQNEIGFVHRAALDTLIQLGVTVPGDKLMPLYNKCPNEVVILLARAPQENQQAILSIAQQAQGQVYWLAACNLLTESKAPGFAAWLIKELKIDVQITVSDDKNDEGGTGGESGTFGIGATLTEIDGFPPTALYILEENAERGMVIAASGLHPIYYRRTVGDKSVIARIREGDKDSYRLEYLAALLDTTVDDLEIKAHPRYSIIWQDAESYQRQVEQIRQQVKEGYERLIQRLLAKNRLTNSEVDGLAPTVVVTVEDLRKDPSVPLPAIPGVVKRERQ